MRLRLQLWLGVAGFGIAAAIIATRWPPWPNVPFDTARFCLWTGGAVTLGFLFRVLRRAVFFSGRMSPHKAFSFDALFQAAILVNPQLRYPDVESEFLAFQTNAAPDSVSPWFVVREASAVAIPFALAGVTAVLVVIRRQPCAICCRRRAGGCGKHHRRSRHRGSLFHRLPA